MLSTDFVEIVWFAEVIHLNITHKSVNDILHEPQPHIRHGVLFDMALRARSAVNGSVQPMNDIVPSCSVNS